MWECSNSEGNVGKQAEWSRVLWASVASLNFVLLSSKPMKMFKYTRCVLRYVAYCFTKRMQRGVPEC